MSRRIASAVLCVSLGLVSLCAAIVPERLGDFQRVAVTPFTPAESSVYQEYGLDAAEKASYEAGSRKLEITALRAKDPTGALAIFQWLQPPGAKAADFGERGVQSGQTTLFQFGNYVLLLRGDHPEPEHLELLLAVLPRLEKAAPPPLLQFVPVEARAPGSERYLLGPVVLEKLAPAIPPSVAGFHLGAEGQIADYSAPGGRLTLALFYYPTGQIARAQLEEFQKLPDLMVKRSGPLVAAVLKPFSADEAAKLLARVRYEASISWAERGLSRRDNVGDLILNILLLTGIILGLALVAGIALGGGRVLLSRLLPGSKYDSAVNPDFIRLHLTDNPPPAV